jgi:hypothetical protein
MIAAAAAAIALTCSVSSIGGVGGLVREHGVPVMITVDGAGFAASGHFDRESLTDRQVEDGAGRTLLFAHYADLPAATFKASLGSLETAAPTIEWRVLEATGAPRKQVLASHGSGTCTRRKSEGLTQ